MTQAVPSEAAGGSLCDTCMRPGACCFGFVLSGQHWQTGLDMLVMVAQQGLPFVPLFRRPNGVWKWWCPLLGKDGRCTEYDRRPYVCREFEPAQDPLCVHHVEPKGCLGVLKAASACLVKEPRQ